MAREILVGKDGKAEGISYIDKATARKSVQRHRGVAASACESPDCCSTRSLRYPGRRGEFLCHCGRYLTDSSAAMAGRISLCRQNAAHNHDALAECHMYIPWWKFDRRTIPAGYQSNLGRTHMPGVGMFMGCATVRGIWRGLKQRLESYAPVSDSPAWQMIPNPDNVLRDRSRRRPSVGHSGAALHFKFTDYELRQAQDMQQTSAQLSRRPAGNTALKRRSMAVSFGIQRAKNSFRGGTARMVRTQDFRFECYCQAHM